MYIDTIVLLLICWSYELDRSHRGKSTNASQHVEIKVSPPSIALRILLWPYYLRPPIEVSCVVILPAHRYRSNRNFHQWSQFVRDFTVVINITCFRSLLP